jgi:hypothetical protein
MTNSILDKGNYKMRRSGIIGSSAIAALALANAGALLVVDGVAARKRQRATTSTGQEESTSTIVPMTRQQIRHQQRQNAKAHKRDWRRK